jgi:O-antigen/teichoic acid export membrane protein
MQAANRVIKNTGILYAKMGITMFISLYTTRLILGALGASDFGVFNVVGGAIAMLGFLDAAMSGATQRFMSFVEGEGNKEKQKSIFNIAIVLHFLISLLAGILLLIGGFIFFHGMLNIPANRIFAAHLIYYFMIVSTMFTIMTVPYDAVINAHENMLYYSVVGIIESILKLIVAIVIVQVFFDKLILYGALMAAISLAIMLIMRVYCHRNYEECSFHPFHYWNKGLMIEMATFAGWNFLGAISTLLSGYGLGIVMNMFHGTIANAAQGIANQISGQLGVLGTSIKKSLNPVIAKSAGAKDYKLMARSTVLGTKIIFFVVAVCFLPFMIEMPYILKLWLKNPPAQASVFCGLLLLTNLLDQLVLFLPQAIGAVGRIKGYQTVFSVLNLLPLLIAWIAFQHGAPAYTIYAITAMIAIVKDGTTIYFADKLNIIPYGMYIRNVVGRCSVSFVLPMVICNLPGIFLDEGLFRLIMVVVISIVTYSISAYFIGFNKEEQIFFRQKIAKIYSVRKHWNQFYKS